jgi:hypothetical protein
VHRYDEHLEVYYAGELQVKIPRQSGRGKVMMDYRHIIHWLVRKPGAFRDYRYHEQLFPTLVFRKAYDELNTACSPRVADREYVELLQLAAREGENLTELAIRQLQEEGKLPRLAAVLERLPKPETELPNLIPLPVDLQEYDTLLVAAAGEVPHE